MGLWTLILERVGVGKLLFRQGDEKAAQQMRQWIVAMARANELGLLQNSMKSIKRAGRKVAERVALHSIPNDEWLNRELGR